MMDTLPSNDVANADHFIRVDSADAHAVAHTRHDFVQWLRQYFDLDPMRLNDLVLAANEALANAAEFAYLTSADAGSIGLRAEYNPGDARLTVTITDSGLWHLPDAAARNRGRGIPLMRALSDRALIETSSQGTEVCLEWDAVSRATR
jgi:serine/threonine-protein kinase RsbW